jgi:hypothetical protein
MSPNPGRLGIDQTDSGPLLVLLSPILPFERGARFQWEGTTVHVACDRSTFAIVTAPSWGLTIHRL